VRPVSLYFGTLAIPGERQTAIALPYSILLLPIELRLRQGMARCAKVPPPDGRRKREAGAPETTSAPSTASPLLTAVSDIVWLTDLAKVPMGFH
jgi:hypothetical protein